jgi:hypothetical protein
MGFDSGTNTVSYILTATLLLVVIVNQLAAAGSIRRNGFIGIRIPPTLASDAGWLAGHPCIVVFALTLTWSLVAAWRGAGRS